MQWCLPRRGGATSTSARCHGSALASAGRRHDFDGALLSPPTTQQTVGGGDGRGFFFTGGARVATDNVIVAVVINRRSAGAATALARLRHVPGVHLLVLERDTRRLTDAMTALLASLKASNGECRFLAGGGDGTAAAVATLVADACERAGVTPSSAPVAPLPLGTVGV